MMVFSFFFVLFYTVTHAILSAVGLVLRGILKVFSFVFGVGREDAAMNRQFNRQPNTNPSVFLSQKVESS